MKGNVASNYDTYLRQNKNFRVDDVDHTQIFKITSLAIRRTGYQVAMRDKKLDRQKVLVLWSPGSLFSEKLIPKVQAGGLSLNPPQHFFAAEKAPSPFALPVFRVSWSSAFSPTLNHLRYQRRKQCSKLEMGLSPIRLRLSPPGPDSQLFPSLILPANRLDFDWKRNRCCLFDTELQTAQ